MRHFLFLIASGRENGNAEQLARIAAQGVPEGSVQTWLRLQNLPLPSFEDIRHSVGVYPQPTGNLKILLEATLACTDLVMVAPLYWYSLPASLKLYLDHWSGWMRVPGLEFRRRMHGKTIWVISSSSGDPKEAQPLFDTLRLSAEYMHMRWGGSILGSGSKPGEAVQDEGTVQQAGMLFRG